MKPIFTRIVSVLLLTAFCQVGFAQTYTVTSNGESWNTLVGGNSCSGCTIIVPAAWAISLNSPGSCAGCTFSGGTLNVTSFSFTGTTTFESNTVNLNNGITFNNPVVFNSSTVNFAAAVGVTMNGGILTVTNSTFNMPAGSSLTANKGLTSSGSNYHITGATLTVNSPGTTFSGDNVSMSGASTATFNGGMSLTNGSFTTSGTASVTVNSTFSSTNSDLSFSNTSEFKPSSTATISGGSVTLNDNAKLDPSGTLTVTGSTVTANSGSTISASNLDLENTKTVLKANSKLTVSGTITVGTGSGLTIGDGTGSAGVTASNLNVTGGSWVGINGGANTLKVSSGKFKNDGGNVTIGSSITGCESLSNSGAVSCTILAVANIDLTATLKGSTAVALSWKDDASATATGYQVQRSTLSTPWITLATEPAEAGANAYRFEDDAAPAGTVEYRIVHLDKDGTESYSAISSVDISGTDASAGAIRIFPNPAIGHTFNIATASTAEWIANVYTLTGQLLLRTSLEGQTQYAVRLPSQLMSGTAVVVQVIGRSATQTFTVLLR